MPGSTRTDLPRNTVELVVGSEPSTVYRIVALVSARVLGNLLYEVSTLDPVTYLTVVGVLVFMAGLASYLPAYRETRVDPRSSIRAD